MAQERIYKPERRQARRDEVADAKAADKTVVRKRLKDALDKVAEDIDRVIEQHQGLVENYIQVSGE